MSSGATAQDGLHTVARWIGDRAAVDPDRVAVDDGTGRVTYGELDARCAHLAAVMVAAGMRPGDRIATLTVNSTDHVVAFFACARARLALVPLSWRLSPREVADQLRHCEAGLLLVQSGCANLAADAVARLDAPPPTERLGLDGIEARPAGPAPGAPVSDGDPLLIMYTSGTTGRPKGVVLTQANCFWTNLSLSRRVSLSADDVVLSVLPQFHVGGWNIQPLLAWWLGATVLLEPSFDAGRVLSLIATAGVTTMMGVPANYLFLAEHPEFARVDMSRLRHAIAGGAAMPESLLRTWHARGVGLVQGYGLSEASPNVLCLPDEDARRKAGYAGKPYPYVEVAVADLDTGAMLDGAADGELLVRGPNVFSGYWRDPETTARALRGGWLHTGDVVHRDAEGYFRIVDRADDMFISGGENISPGEVENVLYRHPAVAEAAVVGVPDPRWGQVGAAFVVRRAGCDVGAAELMEYCRAELAHFKVPRSVDFVESLPHSAVGKLLRRELRPAAEHASAGRTK